MTVSVLDAWDTECEESLQRLSGARLCHTYAWSDMVARTFKHRTFYLVAREGDRVRGVLPLTQVRSRIFGNRLVSQAFSNYGGPLGTSPAALDALYSRAIELASELGCESIEFRNVEPLTYDLLSREDKVTMHLRLSSDPAELWHSFKPEIRNRIRKAEKSDLVATSGGPELLEEFHRLWTIRMRQLGTPCYSRRLFRNILETFPQDSRIFVVRLRNLTVGAGFCYSFNGLAQCRWAATRIAYNQLSPNNLLYWSAIRHYCLAGASSFDFGRSTFGGPTYEFKRRWGTHPIQLHYQYWVRPGHALSVATPDSPKYKRKVELWKKLPLWTTRLIGPYISRNLP